MAYDEHLLRKLRIALIENNEEGAREAAKAIDSYRQGWLKIHLGSSLMLWEAMTPDFAHHQGWCILSKIDEEYQKLLGLPW